MASGNDVRAADENDYWSECADEWYHYTYFHTETCNGLMHSILCNQPSHHDQMSTFDVCTENCAVYRREQLENYMNGEALSDIDEVDVFGSRHVSVCDTETCNGYMHSVLCTDPSQHDCMASFFFCNERCETYQRRKRKLELRMTEPGPSVPAEELDPSRRDVDVAEYPNADRDTLSMDEFMPSISCNNEPEASTSKVEDWLNRTLPVCAPQMETEPRKTSKAAKRLQRKSESIQKNEKRSCKRKRSEDSHVVLLVIEEEEEEEESQHPSLPE